MRKVTKTIAVSALALSVLSGSALAASFKDMQSHWAKPTVEWAVEKNMAKGYPDGTFKPNNNVVESEFLAMLIRAYEGEKAGGSHWADGYYTFAKQMNYPTGTNRSGVITRGQVAEVITGTQGVNYTGNDAVHYLLLNGLAKGKDPSKLTIASFAGDETLTRAEAVQFIKNVLENGVEKLQPRPTTPSPALPKIGVNDQIIPLKEVPLDYQKPQQPQPEQPKPEQPTDPKKDKNNNSPEIIQERIKDALNVTPEFGITKEDIEHWGWEMYRLGQKAEIVNGKLRLYYPQIPEDKKDKWYIAVNVDNNGKRNKSVHGAYGKLYDYDTNAIKSRNIPEYEDFDIVGNDYSFYISLALQGDLGAKPFASTGYNSVTQRISVNSHSIEWNHVK